MERDSYATNVIKFTAYATELSSVWPGALTDLPVKNLIHHRESAAL